MPKKPTNYALWAKMLAGGALMCVGGPMLTVYLMPTDEELFKRYNPELQKRSLERRDERLAEFNGWLQDLKRQSQSNKPIWVVQEEDARVARAAKINEAKHASEKAEAQREAMQEETSLPTSTGNGSGKTWYQRLTPAFASSSSSSSS